MSEPLPCVLLVEDEPQIRRFVRDALRREGLAAIEAGSAQQGLDAATTSRIARSRPTRICRNLPGFARGS